MANIRVENATIPTLVPQPAVARCQLRLVLNLNPAHPKATLKPVHAGGSDNLRKTQENLANSLRQDFRQQKKAQRKAVSFSLERNETRHYEVNRAEWADPDNSLQENSATASQQEEELASSYSLPEFTRVLSDRGDDDEKDQYDQLAWNICANALNLVDPDTGASLLDMNFTDSATFRSTRLGRHQKQKVLDVFHWKREVEGKLKARYFEIEATIQADPRAGLKMVSEVFSFLNEQLQKLVEHGYTEEDAEKKVLAKYTRTFSILLAQCEIALAPQAAAVLSEADKPWWDEASG